MTNMIVTMWWFGGWWCLLLIWLWSRAGSASVLWFVHLIGRVLNMKEAAYRTRGGLMAARRELVPVALDTGVRYMPHAIVLLVKSMYSSMPCLHHRYGVQTFCIPRLVESLTCNVRFYPSFETGRHEGLPRNERSCRRSKRLLGEDFAAPMDDEEYLLQGYRRHKVALCWPAHVKFERFGAM
jgi:hypothetical protein